jgi:copper chaperone
MSCGGCSGAVERILNKAEGVESFDIDLEAKKVTVRGSLDNYLNR